MMLRPLLLIPSLALVLALTSCSKSGLVNAKGRLTYKGKGVRYADVQLKLKPGKTGK